MPDGVFVPREDGVRFEPLPPPTQAEVERLLRVVRHRVLRLLEKRGALPAHGPEDALQTYQAHSSSSGCAGRRWTCGSLPENSPGAPSWRDSPCTPIRTCMRTTGKDWSGYAATGHAERWHWSAYRGNANAENDVHIGLDGKRYGMGRRDYQPFVERCELVPLEGVDPLAAKLVFLPYFREQKPATTLGAHFAAQAIGPEALRELLPRNLDGYLRYEEANRRDFSFKVDGRETRVTLDADTPSDIHLFAKKIADTYGIEP